MNYKLLQVLITLIFLTTACAPAVIVFPTATVTATETPSPRPTNTSSPTETLNPSITPLPIIPTFTQTFDASTIIRVTPAPKAECPKENSEVVATFATPDKYGFYEMELHRPSEILDYLNSGGQWASEWGPLIDLTGDDLSEVVFKSMSAYSIFGCKNGKYEDLLLFSGDFDVVLEGTPDLNKNGIPEVILLNRVHYGYIHVSIFEWDGNEFRSLIDMGRYAPDDPPIDWVTFNEENYKLADMNADGFQEIVVVYDVHQQSKGVLGGFDIAWQRPLRDQTIILGWNGRNFVNTKQGNNAPPEYRFQAVQDGDEQVRFGNYKAALSFYQAAIFDDRLEWWSPERREYEIQVLQSEYGLTATVFPTPMPDNTEYPRLAAYAYYRIMLLHFAQEHNSDAGTVYKTLEQKFENSQYGRSYYEMATAFWEAYQATQSMYNGCVASIQYAVVHPEILTPLGSDYHGGYSYTYVPADVCPFR